MRLPVTAIVLLWCVSIGAARGAAQAPTFSGTWIRVADTTLVRTVATRGDASFRTGDMDIGFGSPLEISQTSDRVVLAYIAYTAYDLQPRVRFTVALNGEESRNRVVLGSDPETRSRAVWDDSVLVVTTTYPAPPGVHADSETLSVRHTIALDRATGRLTITARRRAATGGWSTVVATYRRQ